MVAFCASVPVPSKAQRAASSLWLVPVLALAAWVRVNVFARVLVAGKLRPADADSEYHLYRILEALPHWPRISTFDPLLAWPRGHSHVWAPLFDWCGAGWVLATGATDRETQTLAAALFPVILGVLTVWVVIDLARRLAPQAPGVTSFLAGTFAALVPQFVGCSRLARDDHHVWEALSVALLASWIVRRFDAERGWRFELLRRPRRADHPGRLRRRAALRGDRGLRGPRSRVA